MKILLIKSKSKANWIFWINTLMILNKNIKQEFFESCSDNFNSFDEEICFIQTPKNA
jgi:hypothetical protein